MSEESEQKLNREYYEKLGMILVSFQALEEAITFALIKLTRFHNDDDIDINYVYALSELSFRSRLKLLRNHLQKICSKDFMYSGCPSEEKRPDFFEKLLTELREATVQSEKIEDQRNQYIHSVWNPSESDPERTARRYKLRVKAKKTSLVNEEVPIENLNDLLKRTKKCKGMISTCTEILGSVIIEKRDSSKIE